MRLTVFVAERSNASRIFSAVTMSVHSMSASLNAMRSATASTVSLARTRPFGAIGSISTRVIPDMKPSSTLILVPAAVPSLMIVTFPILFSLLRHQPHNTSVNLRSLRSPDLPQKARQAGLPLRSASSVRAPHLYVGRHLRRVDRDVPLVAAVEGHGITTLLSAGGFGNGIHFAAAIFWLLCQKIPPIHAP